MPNAPTRPPDPNPYESPTGEDLPSCRKRLNEAFFHSGFLFGIVLGWAAGVLFCLAAMSISDRFRELGY